MSEALPVIAILGGTGEVGTGLAQRWIQSGYKVIIGSRSEEKASAAVKNITDVMGKRGIDIVDIQAMKNLAAAKSADICTMTVPFENQQSTLEQIKAAVQGKIFIDVTVPLIPPKVARVQLPEQGSAGMISQLILGEAVHVVSAFQNVAAKHLQADHQLNCDVIVCGNKKEARSVVITLVEAAGMRGYHGGSIANSAATEALTSVLIFINKHYDVCAGISITGAKTDTLLT